MAAAAVFLAATSVGACSGNGSSRPPRPAAAASALATVTIAESRATARSVNVIRAQQAALDRGHLQRFAETWSPRMPASRREGRRIAANLRALRISGVSLKAAPLSPSASVADAPPAPPGLTTWSRDVVVSWRQSPRARRVVTRLSYRFVAVNGRAFVLSVAAAPRRREPIWLAGRLYVRQRGGVVVAAATSPADAADIAHRAQLARRDVRAVLPCWKGVLTVYLPATTHDFDRIVGAMPGEYDATAAVTTTVDGSQDPLTPVAIVLNPTVWPLLRPLGAQVVVTHEAVHAATGAATGAMPGWVAEGFADYVAIRSAGVPTAVASHGALRWVRRHGPPARLPADAGLATTNADAERSYELSRLVMVTIVRHAGQTGLVDFYRDVASHPADVAGALRRELGTSRALLTRQWRRLLVRLAGAQ